MKQFYYHITTKAWPGIVTLKPRKDGPNRAEEEPEISRTCVASTIEGCIIALGSCLPITSKVYIYRTVRKVNATKPHGVIDSKITGEMWLLRPIKFKYIATINKKALPEYIYWMDVGQKKTLKSQKKYKKILKKNINNICKIF